MRLQKSKPMRGEKEYYSGALQGIHPNEQEVTDKEETSATRLTRSHQF